MMVDSSSRSPNPIETESLLEQVNEQLAQGNFDFGNTLLLKQMTEALADKRGIIRLGFVEAFGKIGKPVVPFLLSALAHNPNPIIRRSAAKALAKIDEPNTIPILVNALLKDDDTVVRASAAGALGRRGAAAVPALLAVIEGDYSKTIKGQAVWALSMVGAEASSQLYEAINSKQIDIRVAVIGALANIASSLEREHIDEKLQSVIVLAINDQSDEVRLEATTALSRFPSQFALSHLLPLLNALNPEIVKAAILSLGKLGDPAALSPLQLKLTDERKQISDFAEIAINQIKQLTQNDEKEISEILAPQ